MSLFLILSRCCVIKLFTSVIVWQNYPSLKLKIQTQKTQTLQPITKIIKTESIYKLFKCWGWRFGRGLTTTVRKRKCFKGNSTLMRVKNVSYDDQTSIINLNSFQIKCMGSRNTTFVDFWQISSKEFQECVLSSLLLNILPKTSSFRRIIKKIFLAKIN